MMWELHQASATLCLAIGWPANLLLIWLILYRTGPSLRIWSRVLLQMAVVDLVVSLVFFLVHPVPLSDGHTVSYVLNGSFAKAPQPVTLALYYLYSFCNEFAKYAVAVQFVYRWLVICCERKLSNRLYALLLCVPSAMALLVVLIIHWGISMDGLEPKSCSLCPPGQTIVFSIRQDSLFLLLVTAAVMVSSLLAYTTIFVTSLAIWLKTRKLLQLQHQQQAQSREISRQIGLVLVIQAAIPLLLYLLPTGLVLVYNAMGIARPEWLAMAFVQSWPSVVYPLATMLIVGPYRRSLRKMVTSARIIPKTMTQFRGAIQK